jgi:transcriptional regulator with XRE-family HTH domain
MPSVSEKQSKPWGLPMKIQRVKLEKSQDDVAFEAGISQGHYSELERGDRNPFSLATGTFLKLAKALEWDTNQLTQVTETGRVIDATPIPLEPIGTPIPTYLMPTSPKGGLNTLKEANLREVVDPGWPGTHNAFVLDPVDKGVQTTVIIRMLTQEEKPHTPLGSYLLYEHEGIVGLAVLVEVEDNKYFFNDRNGKIYSRSGIRLLGVQKQIRIENLPG